MWQDKIIRSPDIDNSRVLGALTWIQSASVQREAKYKQEVGVVMKRSRKFIQNKRRDWSQGGGDMKANKENMVRSWTSWMTETLGETKQDNHDKLHHFPQISFN